jgi:hypothetical protein
MLPDDAGDVLGTEPPGLVPHEARALPAIIMNADGSPLPPGWHIVFYCTPLETTPPGPWPTAPALRGQPARAVRYVRVTWDDCPLSLEVRVERASADPDAAEFHIAIGGLEQVGPRKHLDTAYARLAKWNDFAAQWRSRPTKPKEPQAEARKRLWDAARRVMDREQIYPEQLTHALLAHELNRRAPDGKGGRVSDLVKRAGYGKLRDFKHALELEGEKFQKLQGDHAAPC